MKDEVYELKLTLSDEISNVVEHHFYYVLIGGILCIIAIIIAGHHIIFHLKHFNQPQIQLYIVRILLMVPVSEIINK